MQNIRGYALTLSELIVLLLAGFGVTTIIDYAIDIINGIIKIIALKKEQKERKRQEEQDKDD